MLDFLRKLVADAKAGPAPDTDRGRGAVPTDPSATSDQVVRVPEAVAALMFEVAAMDDSIDGDERQRIAELVRWRFKLSEAETAGVLDAASSIVAGPSPWHGLAQTIRDTMEEPDRVAVVEMLWDIVFADGQLHHLEDNLMRRVVALLHVSDHASAAARKRARERHGLTG